MLGALTYILASPVSFNSVFELGAVQHLPRILMWRLRLRLRVLYHDKVTSYLKEVDWLQVDVTLATRRANDLDGRAGKINYTFLIRV